MKRGFSLGNVPRREIVAISRVFQNIETNRGRHQRAVCTLFPFMLPTELVI